MARLIDHLRHVSVHSNERVSLVTQRISLKEVLQVYALSFLYRHERYRMLRFYGGTCARLLYGLNRLSEDIDLDNTAGVELGGLEHELQDFFRIEFGNQYQIEVVKDVGAKHPIVRYTVKFPILYDLSLADVRDEKLHIKVEVSLHQQEAVVVKSPLVMFDQSMVVAHFDEASLMAGKMIACLKRNFVIGKNESFVKGRDFYDLIWYMQRGVRPNEQKLRRELEGYRHLGDVFDELGKKIEGMSERELAVDVRPLFADGRFVDDWLVHFKEFFEMGRGRYV